MQNNVENLEQKLDETPLLYNRGDAESEAKLLDICSNTHDFKLTNKEKAALNKISDSGIPKKLVITSIGSYIRDLERGTFNPYSFNYNYIKACLYYLIVNALPHLDSVRYLKRIQFLNKEEERRKSTCTDIRNHESELKRYEERRKELINDSKPKVKKVNNITRITKVTTNFKVNLSRLFNKEKEYENKSL